MAGTLRRHRAGPILRLSLWPKPPNTPLALDHMGQRAGRHPVACNIRALLLVYGEFRQLQRDLWLARRRDRLHDLALDFGHRRSTRRGGRRGDGALTALDTTTGAPRKADTVGSAQHS